MNACMHVHLHPPSWNPITQFDPPREAACVCNYTACLHETACRRIARSGVEGNVLSQHCAAYRRFANHFSTLNIVAVPSYPINTPPAPTNYIQLLQYLALLRYRKFERPGPCTTKTRCHRTSSQCMSSGTSATAPRAPMGTARTRP